jgi:hypothetical protein
MKTMHVADFKAQFSDVMEWVQNGEEIRVIKGRSGELAGYFMMKEEKPKKRILGALSHVKGFYMAPDFNETTDEEFDINGEIFPQ